MNFNIVLRSPSSVVSTIAKTAPGSGGTTRTSTRLRNSCILNVGVVSSNLSGRGAQGGLGRLTLSSSRAGRASLVGASVDFQLCMSRASCPLIDCTGGLYSELGRTNFSMSLGRCDGAVVLSEIMDKGCSMFLTSSSFVSIAALARVSCVVVSDRRVE